MNRIIPRLRKLGEHIRNLEIKENSEKQYKQVISLCEVVFARYWPRHDVPKLQFRQHLNFCSYDAVTMAANNKL